MFYPACIVERVPLWLLHIHLLCMEHSHEYSICPFYIFLVLSRAGFHVSLQKYSLLELNVQSARQKSDQDGSPYLYAMSR